MESRDVLKIHGKLRRYCTSSVSLRSTLEVQYLFNTLCIFNTSQDSMVYLYYLFIQNLYLLLHILLYIFMVGCIFQYSHQWMYFFFKFFKNEESLKKNTSTSGCIEKYISLVKMYKKIRNRKIELRKKIILNPDMFLILSKNFQIKNQTYLC